MNKNLVKIFLFDDNNIYRKGLKLLLNRKPGYRVEGEAGNSEELFNALEFCVPDLIIINTSLLPVELNKIFLKLNGDYNTPFICFVVNDSKSGLFEYMKFGASGILSKENTTEQLFEAIDTVVSGEKYLHGPVSRITSKIIQHAHNAHFDSHDFSELSDREIEVLKRFANGFSYKEIGLQLHISPRTVETHKNNILSKLGLLTTADMIKYAIRHELIDL